MSATDQPSEEELRAAYEAELKKIRVEQILLENVVTLINLGMRRTGLQPGTEDERDPEQVRVAIEGVRALLPLVDQAAGPQAGAIREALSQMQMAYVQISGGAPGAGAGAPGADPAGQAPPPPPTGQTPPPPPGGQAPPPAQPGDDQPGPAQRSGRLWVPGQP
jgi:hypothetical protein